MSSRKVICHGDGAYCLAASTQSSTVATASSTPNAGVIAGCVVSGVVFLVLVVLGILLYLRARKRRRTPPSSEFINSIRAGAPPVLRLDSGAEYTPALSEKGCSHTHYPPTAPSPFTRESVYTSQTTLNTKSPDDMKIDILSERPQSVERALHPQRYSSQFVAQHHPSASVGSRPERWGSEAEVFPGRLSPVRRSPAHADSVLQFVPRFSLDEPFPAPLHPSHSPPSLHPLRRRPDPEGT